MKRLLMFLVVGMLLVPAVGWPQVQANPAKERGLEVIRENSGLGALANVYPIDQVPEATSGFRIPVETISVYGNTFEQWDDIYCTSSVPPGSYHPGVDLNSPCLSPNDCSNCDRDRGTNILAIANGKVVYVDVSNWGGIVIQHNWKGQTWFSQYGHVNAPLVAAGDNVVKGQHIAEMSDVGTDCVHLHWEIRKANHPNPSVGNYWTCSILRNLALVGDYYEDPEVFVASHGSYSSASFRAIKTGQNVSITPWLPANSAYPLSVDYRNDGSATWNNSGGTGYVELRSVDGGCGLFDSFCAYDVGTWINRQRIGHAQEASVPYGSTAHFQFVARAASTTGTCVQWVAPWANGQCMDGWGGVNFTVRTDASGPVHDGVPTASPSTSTVNSFSFSWLPFTDNESGVKQYHWNIDGLGDNVAPSNSLPVAAYAPGAGTHNFTVWAEDNVGNIGDNTTVQFAWNPPSGPCPGREIVGCSNPPHTCINPAAPGIIMSGVKSAMQWQAEGEPVREPLLVGKTYSIGLEYRATEATDIKLGFGDSSSSATNINIVGQSLLPKSASGEWRTFWSAPFTLTADQLPRAKNLRLVSTKTNGLEFRNVRILAY